MEIRKIQQAMEELIFVGQSLKIGIFKELAAKEDTAHGLAGRMKFNNRAAFVLLEALAEMKYLIKKGDVYSVPADVSERLINEKSGSYEGDFWKFLLYLIEPWQTLEHVLKEGKPDQSSYKNLSIEDFIKSMDSPWKKMLAPEIVNICLEHNNNPKKVIDIGGAPGTIAKEFAGRGIPAVIFDLPECLEVTCVDLSKIKNIELIKGDATESLPDIKCGIAFLGNLCHGQSPEDNQKIISMCHGILDKNGIIAIFDNVRGISYLGARLALHMLTQSPKGDIYTKEEYSGWLKSSGFKDISMKYLSDKAWQLIIARK